MKKLAAAVALVLTSFVMAPALVAPAHAADDDYVAITRTSCHIDVPAVVRVDRAPRIRITVRPNGPAPAAALGRAAARRADAPAGSVEVRVTRGGAGIFSRTVAYNGRPVTIQGPVITQPGHYVVHARFRAADGSAFRGCQATTAFDVGKRGTPEPPPPGGGETPDGGVLPDTGGPDMFWLLLALAAIGTGGGLVIASQRKPAKPLYDL